MGWSEWDQNWLAWDRCTGRIRAHRSAACVDHGNVPSERCGEARGYVPSDTPLVNPRQAQPGARGGAITYDESEVFEAMSLMGKYRAGQGGEVGGALVVVGLSSERVEKEATIRDNMIRVAHRCGASFRQLAAVSGLGRKTVTDIVSQ
jgi:hypothetical protein